MAADITPGEAIRAYRIQEGKKQKQLAADLGVDTQTISRWERNDGEPTAANRERLRQLGVEWPDAPRTPTPAERLDQIAAAVVRIEAALSALRAAQPAGGVPETEDRAPDHDEAVKLEPMRRGAAPPAKKSRRPQPGKQP